MPTKALIAGGKAAAGRYGARLAKTYARPTGGIRPSVTAAAIPDEYLGVTFTYDAETGYGPSNLPGAPENGVRFLVYAIDPISGVPIEPLIEVGHADVVTTETASAVTVRIELVSAGVTFLDYMVGATGGTNALTLTVSGFVSNGDDRVNFDLDTHLTSASVGVDYSLTVPTRGGFRIDFEAEGTEGSLTTALEARGPHGAVTVSGTQTSASGTFDVDVNGELFATITMPGSEPPVIAGADGEALSQAELDAPQAIAAMFVGGADFFEDLLDPIG